MIIPQLFAQLSLLSVSPGLSNFKPGVENSMMPLQFLHSFISPFFWKEVGMQSGGLLCSNLASRSFPRSPQTICVESRSRFIHLPWWFLMVCYRDQLPFRSSDSWMARLISNLPGLFSLSCKGVLAGSLSSISLGVVLLSNFLKSSAVLFSLLLFFGEHLSTLGSRRSV